jgi:hypothetical protein
LIISAISSIVSEEPYRSSISLQTSPANRRQGVINGQKRAIHVEIEAVVKGHTHADI